MIISVFFFLDAQIDDLLRVLVVWMRSHCEVKQSFSDQGYILGDMGNCVDWVVKLIK